MGEGLYLVRIGSLILVDICHALGGSGEVMVIGAIRHGSYFIY